MSMHGVRWSTAHPLQMRITDYFPRHSPHAVTDSRVNTLDISHAQSEPILNTEFWISPFGDVHIQRTPQQWPSTKHSADQGPNEPKADRHHNPQWDSTCSPFPCSPCTPIEAHAPPSPYVDWNPAPGSSEWADHWACCALMQETHHPHSHLKRI